MDIQQRKLNELKAEFDVALSRLKTGVDGLFQLSPSQAIPKLGSLLEQLQETLNENRDDLALATCDHCCELNTKEDLHYGECPACRNAAEESEAREDSYQAYIRRA